MTVLIASTLMVRNVTCLRKLKSKLSEVLNSDRVQFHSTKLVQFLHFLSVIRTFTPLWSNRIKDFVFSSNAANYLNEEESLSQSYTG